MMRGNKLFGGGLLLVLALLLAAVPASASAKTLLEFTEEPVAGETVVAPSGAKAYTRFQIDLCEGEYEGAIGTDPATKVVVKAPTKDAEHCPAGATMSGHIEETTWETSGAIKVKGKIKLSFSAGPCVYEFKKFTPEAKLTFPTVTGFKGETIGKLDKPESSKTKGVCASTLKTVYRINVLDAEEEDFGVNLT